jgi:hypothetical protein
MREEQKVTGKKLYHLSSLKNEKDISAGRSGTFDRYSNSGQVTMAQFSDILHILAISHM